MPAVIESGATVIWSSAVTRLMMMLPPFLPLESRRYQLPDFAYVVAPILEKESSVFGGQSPPIKCLSLDLLGESCFHRAMLPSSPTRLPARESAFSRNGASLWLREAGVAAGAPTVFLHGGPGYNSYVFERVAGPHLEKVLRMVYFDQRACGRSSGDAGADPIAESVADLEALRIYLGAERLQLIGHSLGALLALEYQKVFPGRVSRSLLVEISPDLPAMLRHQWARASRRFRKLAAFVESSVPRADSHEKLRLLCEILGWRDLQKAILWSSTKGQALAEALDRESGLASADPHHGPGRALLRQGYFATDHTQRLAPTPGSATLLAGAASRAVGLQNVERAARDWGIDLLLFKSSGHFPYVEEPKSFAHLVLHAFSR